MHIKNSDLLSVTDKWSKQARSESCDKVKLLQSQTNYNSYRIKDTHKHTRLTALFPGLPGWAGTRKVKPIWILLKQETVNGSGISWATCKSAPHSRQITMPAHQQSVFYRSDALPAAQPRASKHWRQVQKQRHRDKIQCQPCQHSGVSQIHHLSPGNADGHQPHCPVSAHTKYIRNIDERITHY